MLISKKKGFIFFHLPKAAGSSIERALRKHSHIPSTRLYNYLTNYIGEWSGIDLFERHIRPRELKSRRPDLFSEKFLKFAVVRNTWDWHCSQYHFHKNQPKTVFHETLRDMSFSEYVDWACELENISRANSRQKEYLSDYDGTVLVDRVLRFEKLEEEFAKLGKELSLDARLPRTNKSSRNAHYRDEYTDELRQKIAASHQEDISFFGFDF